MNFNSIQAINGYQASVPAMSGVKLGTTQAGTGGVWGTPAPSSEIPFAGRPVQTAYAAQGIQDVYDIGVQKAKGFQNGLGGTNDSSGHKLFISA